MEGLINVSELIWAIINFLILLAVLYKFLYGPLLKTLDNRRKEIEGNLERAEELKKQGEELLAQYNEKLESAKQEAQEIINRATKTGESMKEEMIANAKEEAAKILEKARQEIEAEKTKALAEIRDEMATLAVLAAGKVIGKTLDPKDHERLVKQFVAEVGELQ
ncbi:F0F1 ATP synthase subunit B [Calderihabitans maritimus]|uniref:ATP synthase subunit b n=1 Tax=Calderihabitans maritimus TaxID=1246530 RepID=A0A1Z5HWB2_9FIRM|nr:F0F1 ATP synthase subunit B [Calderihabitans maritimus]GAW93833.1 ATP synthase F0 complex subunit beta [Calderihabitans maritimus]